MPRDDERARRGLGGTARAFLALSGDEAALDSEEPSRARRLAALLLATLVLIAIPLLWLSTGPGDQAVALTAGKSENSGPGGGEDDDDDDNSGPGGDSEDDSADNAGSAATAGTGSRDSARTNGTTRNTAATSDDGASADSQGTGSKNSARSAGTTRGTRGPGI